MTPQQEYILAALSADKVPSRTMLQKLVYFAARLRNESLGYTPYYYGPYSSDVQEAVAELVRAGLVTEQPLTYAVSDRSDRDVVQYGYELTEAGRRAVASVPTGLLADANEIGRTAKANGAFTASGLSFAAKLAHLQSLAGMEVEATDVPTLARELGWEMTPLSAERAARLLRALDGMRPHASEASQ